MVEPMFTYDFQKTPAVGDVIDISGAEAKHAVQVRRMRVDEAIQLTDKAGLRVHGLVKATQKSSLSVLVNSVESESAPPLKLTLVQALAKGDRDELAVQAATELGVMFVIPWESDRSVSRWIGIKEDKGVERWQTIATEAAKQSLRVWHPVVAPPIKGSSVAELTKSFDAVLVLDPTSSVGLASIDFPKEGSIALVVGPEGGISDEELSDLELAGAKLVHLGQPILRTSTAGIAGISAITALTGQWGTK
jgi:16S rRNA (uracil1498-N3)-methyltransferase